MLAMLMGAEVRGEPFLLGAGIFGLVAGKAGGALGACQAIWAWFPGPVQAVLASGGSIIISKAASKGATYAVEIISGKGTDSECSIELEGLDSGTPQETIEAILSAVYGTVVANKLLTTDEDKATEVITTASNSLTFRQKMQNIANNIFTGSDPREVLKQEEINEIRTKPIIRDSSVEVGGPRPGERIIGPGGKMIVVGTTAPSGGKGSGKAAPATLTDLKAIAPRKEQVINVRIKGKGKGKGDEVKGKGQITIKPNNEVEIGTQVSM